MFLSILFGCGAFDPKPKKSPVIKSESKRLCNPKPLIGRIYFDCTIPDEHYETIREDIEFLRTLEFRGTEALELQEMLHLSQLTGESLFHWIEDRVQFVLDESYFASTPRNIGAQNISNSRLNFYRDPFVTIEVPGFGPVIINSQKVGMIQIGPLFFDELEHTLSERFQRINLLLHEARHSDGKGTANGFPHSPCPSGHQEGEGSYACDNCTNGPYGISKLFLKSILEWCSTRCASDDQRHLEFIIRWVSNNILPSAIVCDDSLEFTLGL